MDLADAVVIGLAGAAVLLGLAYLRRYRMPAPPLGTINLSDVGFVIVAVVAVPVLALAMPRWLVAAVLALSSCSLLGVLFEPVLRAPLAVWGSAVGIVALDIGMAIGAGGQSPVFLGLNDAVVVLVAIAIANLWAQGGLRARRGGCR